jgi:GxxExxY protein
MSNILYKDESYEILGSCFKIHNELGCGFLEAVYQECLELEFRQNIVPYVREKELNIYYRNIVLQKKYIADFICYDKIILEIKALNKLTGEHESQVINYLKATRMKLGILINFGEKSLKYKRLVL